jgi:predicted kinase
VSTVSEEAQSTELSNVVIGRQTELIAVCGLPGVGKSTISERISERLDTNRLRTDAVRKELYSDPTYSTQESRTVYRAVFDRARKALAEDRTVVVDASFADRQYRETASNVAGDCGVPFRLLRVECDEAEVLDRIEHRDDISDADVEVYHEMAGAFDPIERECLRIDNSGPLDATLARLDSLLP